MLCDTINLLITFSIVLATGSHAKQDNYVFESWGTTKLKIERLKYTWTIEDFSLYDYANGKGLNSPIFSGKGDDSCKYQLSLFPNGYDQHHSEYISIFLSPLSCPVDFECKFGLLNAQYKEVKSFSGKYISRGRSGSVSYVSVLDVINKHYLLDESNGILNHDKLIVFCEVNTTAGVENSTGIFKKSHVKSSYLGRDLAYLYGNDNYTDVILSAGGTEVKALKAILAARSPIFKTMFNRDRQESHISRIEIKDLSAEVLKEMLRYIYTEEVVILEYFVFDMLAAAVKYELDGLKALCADYMAEHLDVENAAEVYILSDRYYAVELKMLAKEFIATHARKVIRTPKFQAMMKTQPHLVEEAFETMGDLLPISCLDDNN